jgi:uncharacterized membrane protein
MPAARKIPVFVLVLAFSVTTKTAMRTKRESGIVEPFGYNGAARSLAEQNNWCHDSDLFHAFSDERQPDPGSSPCAVVFSLWIDPGCPAAGLVYLVFAAVCHQLPERSFTLWEYPWAVCQRCSGIYLGLLAGALFHGRALEKLARPSARRSVVVGMTLPLMLDVMLPFTGVWTNGPPSRFATGFLFGAMLSLLLVPGVSEFLREAPWKQTHVKAPHTQGGAS